VGEAERQHPWLFNIAVGLLLGVLVWYLVRRPGAVVLVPLLWVPVRVAFLKGRITP